MRWVNTPIPPWYIVWRVTNIPKGVNKNASLLGDRDLTVFKHADFYHFTTYTYTSLNG